MSRVRTSRSQILDAALAALEKGELPDLNMGQVARLARISRQALYLHFEGRTELAIEIARYSDEKYGLEEALAPVRDATNGVELLDNVATFLASFNPRIYPVVRMADALRITVPELDEAWRDRLANRRAGSREVAKRLKDSGELSPEWTVAAAGDWVTSVSSAQRWAELVVDLGWSRQRFTDVTARVLKKALLMGGAEPFVSA